MTTKPSSSNLGIDVLYSYASTVFCEALIEDNYEQIDDLKNWSEIFMSQFAHKGWRLGKRPQIFENQDVLWSKDKGLEHE